MQCFTPPKVKHSLMNWSKNRFIDILFPKSCLTCEADISSGNPTPICSGCLGDLNWCPTHNLETAPPLDKFTSALGFSGKFREIIHAFKYRGKDYLTPTLVDLWTRYWTKPDIPFDAVIPVPMPFWREMRRGYNQASLLAKELGRRWDIPVEKKWLSRRLGFPSQTELSREKRIDNANNSFILNRPPQNIPQRVLLVDDICTTGATLRSCAHLLKGKGVKFVWASTLAQEI